MKIVVAASYCKETTRQSTLKTSSEGVSDANVDLQEQLRQIIDQMKTQIDQLDALEVTAPQQYVPEFDIPSVQYGTFSIRQFRKLKSLVHQRSIDIFQSNHVLDLTFSAVLKDIAQAIASEKRINWNVLHDIFRRDFTRDQSTVLPATLTCSNTEITQDHVLEATEQVLTRLEEQVQSQLNGTMKDIQTYLREVMSEWIATTQDSETSNKCISVDDVEALLEEKIDDMRRTPSEHVSPKKRQPSNARGLLEQPALGLVVEVINNVLILIGGHVDALDRWIDTLPDDTGTATVDRILKQAAKFRMV